MSVQDQRFYLLSAIGMIVLAILASLALPAANLSGAEVNSSIVMILGCAAFLIGQYRTEVQVKVALDTSSAASAAKADEVKDEVRTALTTSAEISAKKVDEALSASALYVDSRADEIKNEINCIPGRCPAIVAAKVKEALAESNRHRDSMLAEIRATGEKTNALIDSDRGAHLKALAVALRQIADLTDSDEARAAAEHAEAALALHESLQAPPVARNILAPPESPPKGPPPRRPA